MSARGDGVETEDLLVPVTGAPTVLVRLHRPEGTADRARPLPVLITFFGGAFVSGSITDPQNRYLAERRCLAGDLVVAAVEYSLAPEHRCPTPVLQGLAVLGHLRREADALGLDPRRMMLGGQSAGGNIAAAVALEDALRRQGDQREVRTEQGRAPGLEHPAPSLLLLEAPVLDLSGETVDPTVPNDLGMSAGDYMAHRELVRSRYQGPDADRYDVLACPLRHPALAAAPPVLLLAAQDDPLRADAEAFHDRLHDAGVPVSMVVIRGLTHDGFRDVHSRAPARLWHDLVDTQLRASAGAAARIGRCSSQR